MLRLIVAPASYFHNPTRHFDNRVTPRPCWWILPFCLFPVENWTGQTNGQRTWRILGASWQYPYLQREKSFRCFKCIFVFSSQVKDMIVWKHVSAQICLYMQRKARQGEGGSEKQSSNSWGATCMDRTCIPAVCGGPCVGRAQIWTPSEWWPIRVTLICLLRLLLAKCAELPIYFPLMVGHKTLVFQQSVYHPGIHYSLWTRFDQFDKWSGVGITDIDQGCMWVGFGGAEGIEGMRGGGAGRVAKYKYEESQGWRVWLNTNTTSVFD